MASLIIQDTFDPYYSGRDDSADAREKPASRKSGPLPRSAFDTAEEIILPSEAPIRQMPVRKERRATAH
jgi:hypothetical protein